MLSRLSTLLRSTRSTFRPLPMLPVIALYLGARLLACLQSCQQGPSEGMTLGEMGRVEFGYDRSCFFTCPLEQPLLSGTREEITVTGSGDDADVVPVSDNRKVAVFAIERECFCEHEETETRIAVTEDADCKRDYSKHCDNIVLVEARAAGDALLQLRDQDDEPIDRVTIFVREADRARLQATYQDRLGAVEADAFALGVNETIELELDLYDKEGQRLLAPEGVTWSVDDDTVAVVSAWLAGSGQQISTGLSADLQGKAPGETELRVDVPGLQASVQITVE